jgi:hypothetical protein
MRDRQNRGAKQATSSIRSTCRWTMVPLKAWDSFSPRGKWEAKPSQFPPCPTSFVRRWEGLLRILASAAVVLRLFGTGSSFFETCTCTWRCRSVLARCQLPRFWRLVPDIPRRIHDLFTPFALHGVPFGRWEYVVVLCILGKFKHGCKVNTVSNLA